MKSPLWLVVVLTTGCGLFDGEVRIVGVVYVERVNNHIEPDFERIAIEVPDTVPVATAFTVSVTTEGGGCYRGGDTEVDVNGSTAIITPYDYSFYDGDGGSAEGCPSILIRFEHIAQVTFDARGASTVVVRSRTEHFAPEIIEYEYAVWVE